ncbi:prepilin-type N-terminal cleavage/methylation domain-containing protein [Solemya velum gill symbiont]|uniref:prepilin-type N-terminal cleavage/methylation domain-containing protein n=1 Tax=Solemya velum gill symbiont TaxID=2340 RepID=UPI0009989C42|nr:prepilin-type N-terminal cleavage/methylation domain-containing protein [Solemya velum gill symbiont]OOY55744.1 type II secretion system protein GspH [Solemya velum gill symbiont]OOY58223.1 type II secretion system protein GspH [Solemya velum gill symbiont]OOY70858.1 type II secretion system protein GspH [Solemya velum gill symbiont]OOY87896.1 type II secretion system protein GspH [Solemya velum gill symbiont]OOY95212.1 type II secretion system protein GspH [Solemya velum gill symbiont]
MNHKRSNGFTLIEILVVLALVGVLVSVAMLAIRGRDAQSVVDESVQQLAFSLRVAGEETLFRRRALGLYLYKSGYLFLASDKEGWYPVNENFFKPREFPEELRLTLYVDAAPQVLDEEPPTGDDAEIKPQIQLIPDAEAIPFDMLFDLEGLQQRKIEMTPTGRILTHLEAEK